MTMLSLSRILMTTLSPWSMGMVETRRSISRSPTLSRMRPSWGSLRSAMFSFAMILIRETMAACSLFGAVSISCSTPSIRYRTFSSSSKGSMWMSLALLSTALVMRRLQSL